MDNQQPSQQQIQVKASDEALKGVYSNMAQIGHTQEEFVLDFMNLFPPAGVLSARVIVSPAHIQRITQALAENIKKYEEQFGSIKPGSVPERKIGFRTE